MLTQHPSQETTQTQTNNFHSMQQSWSACPKSDLANLFYYKLNNVDQRVSAYVLDQTGLQDLFSNVDSSKDINIRIFLGNDSNVPYGTIENGKPSFCPVVQVFNTDDIPTSIDINSKKVHYIPTFQNTTEVPITIGEANQMNQAWNSCPKVGLSNLFEASGQRINFTTFDASDSDTIRNKFNNDPTAERQLYILLGDEAPTPPAHPFGFRFILNLVVNSSGPIVRSEQNCFEFSNPCPPAC